MYNSQQTLSTIYTLCEDTCLQDMFLRISNLRQLFFYLFPTQKIYVLLVDITCHHLNVDIGSPQLMQIYFTRSCFVFHKFQYSQNLLWPLFMSGKEATKKSRKIEICLKQNQIYVFQNRYTQRMQMRLVSLKLHLTPKFSEYCLALREDFLVKYIIITHTLYLHDRENF